MEIFERPVSEGKTNISCDMFDLSITFFQSDINGARLPPDDLMKNYSNSSSMMPLFVQEN